MFRDSSTVIADMVGASFRYPKVQKSANVRWGT